MPSVPNRESINLAKICDFLEKSRNLGKLCSARQAKKKRPGKSLFFALRVFCLAFANVFVLSTVHGKVKKARRTKNKAPWVFVCV